MGSGVRSNLSLDVRTTHLPVMIMVASRTVYRNPMPSLDQATCCLTTYYRAFPVTTTIRFAFGVFWSLSSFALATGVAPQRALFHLLSGCRLSGSLTSTPRHLLTSTQIFDRVMCARIPPDPYRRQPSARCFEANRDRDLLRAVVFH